jgi:hypothetical protein
MIGVKLSAIDADPKKKRRLHAMANRPPVTDYPTVRKCDCSSSGSFAMFTAIRGAVPRRHYTKKGSRHSAALS